MTMCVCLLAACSNPTSSVDVTSNAVYHAGYVPGHEYVLLQDVAAFPCLEAYGKPFARVHPTDDLFQSRFPEGSVYIAPTDRFSRDPVAIVPRGTRIRITKLTRQTFVTFSDVDRVIVATGRIVTDDPQLSNLPVVMTELSTLTPIVRDAHIVEAQSPDPSLLADSMASSF